MKKTPVVTLANDVSSHILENELILFSESQQRLFRLNSTAAFIWYSLEEKQSVDEIVNSLVETFDIAYCDAENDVTIVLNEWQSSGLLALDSKNIESIALDKIGTQPDIDYPFPIPAINSDCRIRFFKLIDTCFRVRFTNKMIEEKVLPLLNHLEITQPKQFDDTLDVIQSDEHYLLIQDGEILDYCIEENGIVPMMHANLLMVAYIQTDCLLAIHAGAIARGEQCILLPAISGSGKSTLTAALVNDGYMYCTDDLALLTHNTHKIRPVPVSIGLKEGAWPVLSPLFPQINDLETHFRADEKLIRYLPPPASSLAADITKTYSVKAIVFPHYQSNKEISINPISPAEALCHLTEAGYDTRIKLTNLHIDELTNWISSIDCYSLVYGNLSDAINKFHKLLP